jgi:signal transduction histidine kinase
MQWFKSSYFYISPGTMDYVPILILHVIGLAYLLLRRPRSQQTWLFTAWLGGMTAMILARTLARTLYGVPSVYLEWWGGTTSVTLALVAWLQFGYRYPRPRYPREARVVLILSLLFSLALFLWMAWETAFYAGRLLHPIPRLDTPGVAYAPQVSERWTLYGFAEFIYGFVGDRDRGWVSIKAFDAWQILANSWVLLLWVRKTIQFSPSTPNGPWWKRAGWALWSPRGEEARTTRTWVLVMLLAPLPVLASFLEPAGVVPDGTFTTVDMMAMFAVFLTFINTSPEPASLMVRLVGISLLTNLLILGLVSGEVLRAHQRTYHRTRRAELAHVKTLVDVGDLDAAPEAVRYVAARSPRGLFAPAYELLLSRAANLSAGTLAAWDAQFQAGLKARSFSARVLILHEHPWLSPSRLTELEGDAQAGAVLRLPEGTPMYRGTSSRPPDHVIRYAFTHHDTLYEVGYCHLDYRRMLHHAALPLLALMGGVTALMLVAFPLFFRRGLVEPLDQLLEGVARVDQGDREVAVPVKYADEIGTLTRAFNRMARSLRASEEELHTLTLTLEQRVMEQTRELIALYEVSAVASQTQDLKTLLSESLTRTLNALRSRVGAIYLMPGSASPSGVNGERPIRLAMEQGLPAAHRSSLQTLSGTRGPVAWVLEHQEPLLLSPAEIRSWEGVGPLLRVLEKHILLLAPLRAEGHIVGLLVLARPPEASFTVREISLVASIADQIGVSVWSEHLRQETILLEERQRIARDLHDAVTQSLYGMVLFTEAGQVQLQALDLPPESRRALAELLQTIGTTARQAIKEMRLFIHELQPPVLRKQGLVGALHQRLASVEGRATVDARLLADETLTVSLEVERALYQIAQEALNNALRHAQAATVTIYWGCEDGDAVLEVRDDGVGFDPAHVPNPGMGLENMHQRATAIGAELKIISIAGGGTRVRVRIPMEHAAE